MYTPVNRETQKPLLTEKNLPLSVTHSPLWSYRSCRCSRHSFSNHAYLYAVPTVLISDPHAAPVDLAKQPSSTPCSISFDIPPSQTSSPPLPPPISTTTISSD